VASGIGIEGVYLAASGLVGSCAIMSLLLTPVIVILSKKTIQLRARTYGRDCIFQLLTLLTLMILFVYGKIKWYIVLCFPILYCIYVSTSVIQEKCQKKEEDQDEAKRAQIFEDDLAHSRTRAEAIGEEIVRREGDESFVKYTSIDVSSFLEAHVQGAESIAKPEKEERVITVSQQMARQIKNRLWANAISVAIKIAESPEDEEDEKRGIFSKILHYLVEVPFVILRNISIPPSNEENWSRIRASFFPIPAFLLFLLFFGSLRPTTLVSGLTVIAIVGVLFIVSITIYFNTHMRRPPSTLAIFSVVSAILAVVWIWGLANLLVDLLEIIGIVANLPLEFLGLTFLAFGNAMPDIATNIAIAKMGLSEMALTACVSEPVFSMLMGLGSSMLRTAIVYNGFEFNLHRKQAKLPFISLCIVLFAQLVFLFYNCWQRFKFSKFVSFFQLLLYAFFFGIVVTLTAILPENNRLEI
jgi:Ca2+/Na+ antiporter